MTKTRKTQRKPERVFNDSMIRELESLDSNSPLEELYQSEDFGLSLNRDLRHHLGMHLLHLRKFNEQTQAAVARAMGTSQGKIAKIEAGLENVTVDTIERLAVALDATLCFSMAPRKCNMPVLPEWWHWVCNGLNTSNTFVFQSAEQRLGGSLSALSAHWTSTGTQVTAAQDELESAAKAWLPESLEVS